MRKTLLLMGALPVLTWGVAFHAPSAHAVTIGLSELISRGIQPQAAAGESIAELVFEDDDASMVVFNDGGTWKYKEGITAVGDHVVGVLGITGLFRGEHATGTPSRQVIDLSPSLGGIVPTYRQTVTKSNTEGKVATLGGVNGSETYPELTGLFEFVVEKMSSSYSFAGEPWFQLRIATDAESFIIHNYRDNDNAGLVLYEDDLSVANTALAFTGWTDDLADATNGDKFAEVGWEGAPDAKQFYLINASGSGFMFSMNFLTDPDPLSGDAFGLPNPDPAVPPYQVFPNILGTTVAGTGTLEGQRWDPSVPVTTPQYAKGSDGDFKVLYAPVPAAVFAALPLMASLGLMQLVRWRRAV